MKKILTTFLVLSCFIARAQSDSSSWTFSVEGMYYHFEGGDNIFLPVFQANHKRLHLEARYNYEDLETFSGWVGYNMEGGGEKVTYAFTPMAGFTRGLTNGVALGLEFTVTMGKFELYSESEYLWDRTSKEYNFFYSWTDLTYSPRDWWWFGISGQRTRLYQTDLEFQRGVMLGAAAGNWELSGYYYNVGFGETFFLLDVTFSF